MQTIGQYNYQKKIRREVAKATRISVSLAAKYEIEYAMYLALEAELLTLDARCADLVNKS
jgi:hypothetical protein